MKVAVIHEMLIKLGGAENVVDDILTLYPEADLFTLIYDENKVSKLFPVSRIKKVPRLTQFIYKLTKNQRFCLLFMARAIESLDFSQYDLVISSSSGFAHGCITKPETLHVVYYHSPARYLWDWTFEGRKDMNYSPFFKKIILAFLAFIFHNLRIWDYMASQRHDVAIAASKQIQLRISKYYKRPSEVIYPSVYTDKFEIWEKLLKDRHYYVITSALTEFKRVDILVNAFNVLGYRLIIIWTGAQESYLKSIAKENIEFVGYRHTFEINEYYKNARWFILPGREDFWIAPIEAMAAWIPVFWLDEGWLTETSINWLSWEFFHDREWLDFIEKFEQFHSNIESGKYDRIKIRNHALKFNKDRFLQEFKDLVDRELSK